jgi:hypothetical protein
MEGGLYYVSDRVSGYKVYELQRVGEDVSRLERMPRDGEASQQAVAREELEAEEARVEAGRRMERAMRKEGIERDGEAEPVRQARVRRQVDPGAFVRE